MIRNDIATVDFGSKTRFFALKKADSKNHGLPSQNAKTGRPVLNLHHFSGL